MDENENLSRYEELAAKWANHQISPEEKAEFIAWFSSDPDPLLVVPADVAESETELRERMLARIRALADIPADTRSAKRPVRRWLGWAAAAAFLLAAGGLWYMYQTAPKPPTTARPVADAAPGKTKAVLTLAGGRQIVLDTAGNGTLAVQGQTSVVSRDGIIAYNGEKTGASLYNTLSTGRGEQSPALTLSDGTRVWLNAASSIRFPVAFAAGSREVEITGEAYFEVQKDAARPFLVKAGGMTVRVLGTRFDVNSYADEPVITTTLLEGSVQVGTSILQPGQQIRMKPDGKINIVDNTDTEATVAWKNGFFQFDHANLQAVMRQLSRWYDVDVRYEGALPDRTFGGKISRSSNASEVLRILELSKVHFTIENKTIVVMP